MKCSVHAEVDRGGVVVLSFLDLPCFVCEFSVGPTGVHEANAFAAAILLFYFTRPRSINRKCNNMLRQNNTLSLPIIIFTAHFKLILNIFVTFGFSSRMSFECFVACSERRPGV